MGLCLPDSCDIKDVEEIAINYFNNNNTVVNNLYEIQVESLNVSDLKLNDDYYYQPSVLLLG